MDKMPNILDRLNSGEIIIGDGGYVFALEKRGYVKAGHWTTESSVEHPEAVEQLAREFARAGGDVTQTFTFYNWDVGLPKGCDLSYEEITQAACDIAKKVARDKGTMVAGGVIHTATFKRNRDKDAVQAELRQAMDVLVKNKVDFLIVEHFEYICEMEWAIELGLSYGLPMAATMCIGPDGDHDGVSAGECAVRMARAGAPILGVTCYFEPSTHLKTLGLMKTALDKAGLSPHLMAQPNGYKSPDGGIRGNVNLPEYPYALEPRHLTRWEVGRWARDAYQLGVRYIGGCCGFEPYHVRAMAEELAQERGKLPEGSEKSDHDLAVHREKEKAGRAEYRRKGCKDFWMELEPSTGRPLSSAMYKQHDQ